MSKVKHVYHLDPEKRGSDECRFLYPYWCHAEKQKLVDVRSKLFAAPPEAWGEICIRVSRPMCADCEQFYAEVAAHDRVCIHALAPAGAGGASGRSVHRKFGADGVVSVRMQRGTAHSAGGC